MCPYKTERMKDSGYRTELQFAAESEQSLQCKRYYPTDKLNDTEQPFLSVAADMPAEHNPESGYIAVPVSEYTVRVVSDNTAEQ